MCKSTRMSIKKSSWWTICCQKAFYSASISPPTRLSSVTCHQFNRSCSGRALLRILGQGIVVCFLAGLQSDRLLRVGACGEQDLRTILQLDGWYIISTSEGACLSLVWKPALKLKDSILNIYWLKWSHGPNGMFNKLGLIIEVRIHRLQSNISRPILIRHSERKCIN